MTAVQGDIHYIWLVLTFKGTQTEEVLQRKFMVANNLRALQVGSQRPSGRTSPL